MVAEVSRERSRAGSGCDGHSPWAPTSSITAARPAPEELTSRVRLTNTRAVSGLVRSRDPTGRGRADSTAGVTRPRRAVAGSEARLARPSRTRSRPASSPGRAARIVTAGLRALVTIDAGLAASWHSARSSARRWTGAPRSASSTIGIESRGYIADSEPLVRSASVQSLVPEVQCRLKQGGIRTSLARVGSMKPIGAHARVGREPTVSASRAMTTIESPAAQPGSGGQGCRQRSCGCVEVRRSRPTRRFVDRSDPACPLASRWAYFALASAPE